MSAMWDMEAAFLLRANLPDGIVCAGIPPHRHAIGLVILPPNEKEDGETSVAQRDKCSTRRKFESNMCSSRMLRRGGVV